MDIVRGINLGKGPSLEKRPEQILSDVYYSCQWQVAGSEKAGQQKVM